MIRRALTFVLASIVVSGCGTKTAKVRGKVTCQNKAVQGTILFSPLGEGEENTGQAVTAILKEDGTYEAELKTIGKHRVVVNPSDIVYPAPPGKEHPCDLSPQEHVLNAGENKLDIDLKRRGE